MANSYLTKDFGSAGNRKTMTFSFWVKRNRLGYGSDTMEAFIVADPSSYPAHHIEFTDNDQLDIRSQKQASGDNYYFRYITDRVFKDTTSWYHFVVAIDTTQGTEANRLKLYVNGVQNLTWSTATQSGGFTQNTDTYFNHGDKVERIGHHTGAGNSYADFNLAHYHFVDGSALAPTVFGQFDSTTGEWKPILSPSVTYGTNGFFLKFENAGALGTDSSGNSKTWTVNGNLKQSINTPSNMFNTLNRNESYQTNVTTAIKYAGTGWEDANTGADGPKGSVGNLAMTKGKWYYEFKYASPAMYSQFGISKAGSKASGQMINAHYKDPFYGGNNGDGFGFQVGSTATLIGRGDATQKQWLTDASNSNSNITVASNGQICMCAFDLDAGKIWWGINGTWNTVPDSTTTTSSSQIASGSNAHFTWTPDGEFYRSGHSEYNRFGNAAAQKLNFGEGRFGTDAVASGNADSAGEGVFEFAPPSGFLAICTKNIKNTG